MSAYGEVVYAFARDFRSRIRNRSWLQRLQPVWKKAVNLGAYVARIAFGTALVISVLVVWLAVMVLMTSGRDDNRLVACGDVGGWTAAPLSCSSYHVEVYQSSCKRFVSTCCAIMCISTVAIS